MQYQPFLPEVASGTIDPRAVVVPLRSVLRHCDVHVGEVTEIDHDARTTRIRLAGGAERELGYDVLVLAPGSTSRVLPIPGSPSTASGSRRFRRRSTSATASCRSST